jgi:osmotically-inducible protein OsmY
MNAMTASQQEQNNEILSQIKNRIKWDKRVSLADIRLSMQNDVLTVSGFVDTSYKKHAVLEIVNSIPGLFAIEDRIVVPSDYYRTDEELANIIRDQLCEVLKLGGEHIEVDVVDGVVKLEGEVFRPRLKAMASGIAWELSGVRDCLNFIEIVDPPHRVPVNPAFDFNALVSLTRG